MATTDMQVTVTQALGVNLIVNTGFEVNTANWWSADFFGVYTPATLTRSTVRAQAGVASLLTTWPDGAGKKSIANHDNVTTVIGTGYTFTAWVWVPTGSPDVRLLAVATAGSAPTSIKDAWVPLTMRFTATGVVHMPAVETMTVPVSGNQCFIDEAFFKTSLMVIADGADTASPAAVTDAATYAVGDRVQATIRTPMQPLVTGKVGA